MESTKSSHTESKATKRKRVTTNASSIIDDRPSYLPPLSTVPHYIAHPPHATYEEQLIIRFPLPIVNAVKTSIAQSTLSKDLMFEFFDERHGSVTFQGKKYRATLVDLPCIIETQKTLDKKQFYKIADISQMIVISEEADPLLNSLIKWPHGITRPMTFARKRRFRNRNSKIIAEDIENIVQRLLDADARALRVDHELKDTVTIEQIDSPNQGALGMDPEGDGEGEGDEDEDDEEEAEPSDDSDFAAEIETGLLEEEQGEETGGLGSDSETETEAKASHMASSTSPSPLLPIEAARAASKFSFSSFENKIYSKVNQLQRLANPNIKKRFEEALQLLSEGKQSVQDYSATRENEEEYDVYEEDREGEGEGEEEEEEEEEQVNEEEEEEEERENEYKDEDEDKDENEGQNKEIHDKSHSRIGKRTGTRTGTSEKSKMKSMNALFEAPQDEQEEDDDDDEEIEMDPNEDLNLEDEWTEE